MYRIHLLPGGERPAQAPLRHRDPCELRLNGMGMCMVTGFSIQIAQLIGAGRLRQVQSVMRQAMMVAVGVGLLFAALAVGISGVLPVWLGGVMHLRSRRQGTPFSRRSTGERRHTKYIIRIVVTISLTTVPRAAPATPIPAPKKVRSAPRSVTVRVGKMNRELNTTFIQHMRILRALGVRMSPLHWSILPPAPRGGDQRRPAGLAGGRAGRVRGLLPVLFHLRLRPAGGAPAA